MYAGSRRRMSLEARVREVAAVAGSGVAEPPRSLAAAAVRRRQLDSPSQRRRQRVSTVNRHSRRRRLCTAMAS